MDGQGFAFPIPVTPETLELARLFVMERWRERAAEIGNPEPADLSGSCKFSSLFAQAVFGGEIQGNYEHQFVRLENGGVLDLNEGAGDVQALRERAMSGEGTGWQMPNPARPWHKVWVGDPHDHDPEWFGCPDHRDSMRSCMPRVRRWLALFGQQMAMEPMGDPSPGMRR